jgi:hypothetical protein
VTTSCNYGNETSCSRKVGEFLDHLIELALQEMSFMESNDKHDIIVINEVNVFVNIQSG